jgi:hypothetical protein
MKTSVSPETASEEVTGPVMLLLQTLRPSAVA